MNDIRGPVEPELGEFCPQSETSGTLNDDRIIALRRPESQTFYGSIQSTNRLPLIPDADRHGRPETAGDTDQAHARRSALVEVEADANNYASNSNKSLLELSHAHGSYSDRGRRDARRIQSQKAR